MILRSYFETAGVRKCRMPRRPHVRLGGMPRLLSPLGESKVNDRPVVGVKVAHKDHKDVKLFFDKANYLLLKVEMRVKDQENDKEVTEEMIFSDYKDVQGTQQAMKLAVLWDGKPHWDITVTEVTLAEKLDDALFTKP